MEALKSPPVISRWSVEENIPWFSCETTTSETCSVVCVGLNAQHDVQVFSRVAQEVLQVADKSVHVAFAGRLVDDVLVIIIAQTTTQLLVVHLWLVFSPSPASSHL